jgi:hypothetical protein
MTTKEKYSKLEVLQTELMAKLKEITDFCDKNDFQFTLDIAYGMGGTYIPPKQREEWCPEYTDVEDWDGWSASSQGC